MTNVSYQNFINASNKTAALMVEIAAGGYASARAHADAQFAGKSAADRHAFARLYLRDAKLAARMNWTRGTVWFNGVCYGLMSSGGLSYVPLFGKEVATVEQLGGYKASAAALAEAIKAANAGEWPFNKTNA